MASDNPPINLLRGWPAPSLLPAPLLRSAASAALADPAVFTPGLLYGPDPGYEPLRVSLASWLTNFYAPAAGPVRAERLAITGGASQNLGILLSAFTDPHYTRAIWIVAPAYFMVFSIFADAGFAAKLRPVREDDAGVDVAALAAAMARCEERARDEGVSAPRYKSAAPKVFKHIVYCVPAFANPSGRTMSLARREALVRLAREYDALVICDDVYDFLHWRTDGAGGVGSMAGLDRAQLPRLVDIDRTLDGGVERDGADGFGNVASNASFSKIAGPGLRVGWCEGSPKFAWGTSQAGTTRSGGAPSQLTSTYVHSLMASGQLQDYIRSVLRPSYARRHARLRAAIAAHLEPLGFSVEAPAAHMYDDRRPSDAVTAAAPAAGELAGGYFVWLSLPPELRGATLAARCLADEDLVIAHGELFEVPQPLSSSDGVTSADAEAEGVKFPRNVRLCFAWEELDLLEEGVRRLSVVARKMIEESRKGDSRVRADSEGSLYVIVGDPKVDVAAFK